VARTGPSGRNAYGPAMLGGSLVLNGLRNGNERVARAGFRSIGYGIRSRFGLSRLSAGKNRTRPTFEYPFSMLPLVEAHRSWASRRSTPIRPSRGLARMVRRELRQSAPLPAGVDSLRLSDGENRVTLERLIWLEVVESGLKPLPGKSGRGTILARPGAFRGSAVRWMRRVISSKPDFSSDDRPDPMSSLSDPPNWPPAYHALTSALLARFGRLAPPSLRPVVWSKLRRAVRYSRLTSSPAGDVAYMGRSTLQPWTIAMTAYAALVASGSPGIGGYEAARNKAFAGQLLDHLESEYLKPGGRVMLSPAVARDQARGVQALDTYAAEVSYAGLTLLGLEWASRYDSPDGAWQQAGSTLVTSADPSRTRGFIRSSRLWAAVRGVRTPDGDRRGDAGPVAALQKVDGEWLWLVPPRPRDQMPFGNSPSSWLVVRSGDGRTLRPLVTSTARQGDRISQRISFGSDGFVAPDQLDVSYAPAGCGGLSYGIAAYPKPIEVELWMPEAPSAGERDSFPAGDITLDTSRTVSVSTGPEQPGFSHPSLTPVKVRIPAGVDLTLDLCRTG
jgi:hypothetical protein